MSLLARAIVAPAETCAVLDWVASFSDSSLAALDASVAPAAVSLNALTADEAFPVTSKRRLSLGIAQPSPARLVSCR